jgi:hypothetical protein
MLPLLLVRVDDCGYTCLLRVRRGGELRLLWLLPLRYGQELLVLWVV